MGKGRKGGLYILERSISVKEPIKLQCSVWLLGFRSVAHPESLTFFHAYSSVNFDRFAYIRKRREGDAGLTLN